MIRKYLTVGVLLVCHSCGFGEDTKSVSYRELESYVIDNDLPRVTNIFCDDTHLVIGFSNRFEIVRRRDKSLLSSVLFNRDSPGFTAYNSVVGIQLFGAHAHSQTIVSVHKNGAIRFWRFADSRLEDARIAVRLKHTSETTDANSVDIQLIDRDLIDIISCSFQDDGEFILCGRRNGHIEAWSIPDKRIVAYFGWDGKPT